MPPEEIKSIPAGTFALVPGPLTPKWREVLWPPPGDVFFEISFGAHRHFLDLERRFDDGDFSEGGYWEGTKAAAFIAGFTAETPLPAGKPIPPFSPGVKRLITDVGLEPHLNRGIKFLSSGEFRKALWLRALATGARALLLEEPLDGLDQKSRLAFLHWVEEQGRQKPPHRLTLLWVAADLAGAPSFFSRRIAARGDTLHLRPRDRGHPPESLKAMGPTQAPISKAPFHPSGATNQLGYRELVVMKGVSVHYGERQVTHQLDLTVARGQHTLISGPNGSGKTTLVNLITGDCPQVFLNDVSLFGRPRGSGETIWEIKAHIGHVSQALHLDYLHLPEMPVEQVLISGLRDTLGLYGEITPDERVRARETLAWLGLSAEAKTPWGQLGYGQQRLLLVARAAIKTPELLLLDEACHGLGPDDRQRVLAYVSALARSGHTTVMMVTHDPAEVIPETRQTLELFPNGLGTAPPWRLTSRS